jgi:predicted aspartyl protease
MGIFDVTIGVGHPEGGDLAQASAMVDTGSIHTILPIGFLEGLRVRPDRTGTFEIADGTEVEYGYGIARISIDGDEWACPVIFGPEGQYLVGATTLEIFGLAVNPRGERLTPRPRRT